MVADKGDQVSLFVSFREFDRFFYQYFQRMSVVTVTHTGSGVGDMVRAGHQIVLADDFIRIVNIQLKTGHDSQVVPKLVLEIGYITQMGEHISHNVDDGVGTTLTFCTILNGQRIIYHVLDATSVFGKRHSFLLSIVLHLLNKN